MHALIVMDGTDHEWITYVLDMIECTHTVVHSEREAQEAIDQSEPEAVQMVIIMDERITTDVPGEPREETGIRLCEYPATRGLIQQGVPVFCASTLHTQWPRGPELEERVLATGAAFVSMFDIRDTVLGHVRENTQTLHA